MELKRVVVTGLGALTPIGNNIEEYWEGLSTGKSGCAPITYFDAEKFKTKFACELKNFNAQFLKALGTCLRARHRAFKMMAQGPQAINKQVSRGAGANA